MLGDTETAYLRHIIQTVEDVLASLLGLDPRFTLVVLWSLWETRSRCSSQNPSHFPSGNALFTFDSSQPLVVDVQQDSSCPLSNPGVAHKHSSNSQGRWGDCMWRQTLHHTNTEMIYRVYTALHIHTLYTSSHGHTSTLTI